MKIHFLRNEKSTLIIVALFFLAGLIFHLIPITYPIVTKLTDVFLLISNGLALFYVFKGTPSGKLLVWSISAFTITFFLEYLGVLTGKIFGDYHYGETMMLQLGNVPVVIALNWMVLIMATYSLAAKFVRNRVLIPVISSVFIVVFDIILEPVAMKLDYWQWGGGSVPIQNYIAWFVISLIFSGILSYMDIKIKSIFLRNFFLLQIVFFLALLFTGFQRTI